LFFASGWQSNPRSHANQQSSTSHGDCSALLAKRAARDLTREQQQEQQQQQNCWAAESTTAGGQGSSKAARQHKQRQQIQQ